MSWDEIKKARRQLSREQGTVIKDWGGKIPIALIYPNSYYLGMSNLGFWEKGSRRILSVESQRPLSDFAVLAFTISYELDYFNVVSILKASGIPLYAADRDERHPLVIAGGPCIIANPMPLSPFFDCLCIVLARRSRYSQPCCRHWLRASLASEATGLKHWRHYPAFMCPGTTQEGQWCASGQRTWMTSR